ncbi:hypothetical protein MRX96_049010 [Rhipicephalus microplus]
MQTDSDGRLGEGRVLRSVITSSWERHGVTSRGKSSRLPHPGSRTVKDSDALGFFERTLPSDTANVLES